MSQTSVADLIEGLRQANPELHSKLTFPVRLKMVLEATALMKRVTKARGDFCLLNPETLLMSEDGALLPLEPQRWDGCGERFFRGWEPVENERLDVFCLGFFMYQLLGLRDPLPSEGSLDSILKSLRREIPRLDTFRAPGQPVVPSPLADIVARATSRDPARRYRSVESLEIAIGHCLSRWHLAERTSYA